MSRCRAGRGSATRTSAPRTCPRSSSAFFEKREVPANHLAGHLGEADYRRHPAVLRHADAQAPGADRPPQLRDHRPGRISTITSPGTGTGDSKNASSTAVAGGPGHGQAARASAAAAAPVSPPGGNGRPAGKRRAAERYLICNADEGDPGAFMNRSLIEGDPHAVLEGMLIAAYTIGASQGYIYIRAEYPLAIERLKKAIGRDARGRPPGRRYPGERIQLSTSRSRKEPAPSSAARRPPSSPRSRASGACPAPARRSPRSPASTASRRSSTTSRRWARCPTSSATARTGTPAPGRRRARGPRPSPSSARSGARG